MAAKSADKDIYINRNRITENNGCLASTAKESTKAEQRLDLEYGGSGGRISEMQQLEKA